MGGEFGFCIFIWECVVTAHKLEMGAMMEDSQTFYFCLQFVDLKNNCLFGPEFLPL